MARLFLGSRNTCNSLSLAEMAWKERFLRHLRVFALRSFLRAIVVQTTAERYNLWTREDQRSRQRKNTLQNLFKKSSTLNCLKLALFVNKPTQLSRYLFTATPAVFAPARAIACLDYLCALGHVAANIKIVSRFFHTKRSTK